MIIASPMAELLSTAIGPGNQILPLTEPGQIPRLATSDHGADVVVVDLAWTGTAGIDGLDVVESVSAAEATTPVLAVLTANGAGDDHLAEAATHEVVRGAVRVTDGTRALRQAAETVVGGRQYWLGGGSADGVVPEPVVARLFNGNRFYGHVAGAIASGQATRWKDVAELSGLSVRTIEAAPERFGDVVHRTGGAASPQAVNQAVLFRWCGERAPYIRSWCRRNGLRQYG